MIEIREGTRQDIQRVLTFLAQVRAEMPHPEWFCLDTPEEFRERMENGSMRLWVARRMRNGWRGYLWWSTQASRPSTTAGN